MQLSGHLPSPTRSKSVKVGKAGDYDASELKTQQAHVICTALSVPEWLLKVCACAGLVDIS